MEYINIITIGSIQKYISESRKMKDLYSASKIISDLVFKLYEELNIGENLILPHKILKGGKNADFMIFKSKEKFSDCREKCYLILKEMIINGKNEQSLDLLKEVIDINHTLIVYDEENYEDCYKKLLRLHQSRKKQQKLLNQITRAAGFEKCSLCGVNNVDSKNTEEKLCTLCQFKRKYTKTNKYLQFPSTDEIANYNYFQSIDRENYEKLIKKLRLLLIKEEVETDIKVEQVSELTLLLDYKNYFNNDREYVNNQIFKSVDGIKQFMNYYAVIRGDIDNLGKWMSGTMRENNEELKEYQIFIAKLISEFGQNIETKTNKYGKVVYAGGDDFLIFAPVQNIFYIVKEITDLICDINNSIGSKYESYEKLTYTMSLAIAHKKTPLRKILKQSQELLSKSKTKDKQKNKIGISFHSNSGKYISSILKNNNENIENMIKSIKIFRESMTQSVVMDIQKIIFDFRNEWDTYEDDIHFKIIKGEIKRIIKRKIKNTDIQKVFFHVLSNAIDQSIITDGGRSVIDVDNVFGYVHVLNNMSRQIDTERKWNNFD